jgi:hypothetical protein
MDKKAMVLAMAFMIVVFLSSPYFLESELGCIAIFNNLL